MCWSGWCSGIGDVSGRGGGPGDERSRRQALAVRFADSPSVLRLAICHVRTRVGTQRIRTVVVGCGCSLRATLASRRRRQRLATHSGGRRAWRRDGMALTAGVQRAMPKFQSRAVEWAKSFVGLHHCAMLGSLRGSASFLALVVVVRGVSGGEVSRQHVDIAGIGGRAGRIAVCPSAGGHTGSRRRRSTRQAARDGESSSQPPTHRAAAREVLIVPSLSC